MAGITSSLRQAGVTITTAGVVPEHIPVEEQNVEQVLARHQQVFEGAGYQLIMPARMSTPAEKLLFEKESWVQMWGINYHRHYLLEIHFETYTDPRPPLAVYNGT